MDAAQAKLDAQKPDNESKPSRGAVAERKLAAAVAADTDAARLEVRVPTGFGSTVQGLIDSRVYVYRSQCIALPIQVYTAVLVVYLPLPTRMLAST